MGNLSSEQADGLIMHSELLYEFTLYKRPIPIQAEEGWAYNMYYTVHGL